MGGSFVAFLVTSSWKKMWLNDIYKSIGLVCRESNEYGM